MPARRRRYMYGAALLALRFDEQGARYAIGDGWSGPHGREHDAPPDARWTSTCGLGSKSGYGEGTLGRGRRRVIIIARFDQQTEAATSRVGDDSRRRTHPTDPAEAVGEHAGRRHHYRWRELLFQK